MSFSYLQQGAANSVLRHGVPQPFSAEAPSSWLSRLALAQGCSPKELTKFLKLNPLGTRDLDHELLISRRPDWFQDCDLPQSAFSEAAHSMSLLAESDRSDTLPLLTWRGRPRFRYCPSCLSERATPYLDVYWRYSSWRYCLRHSCLLLDYCGRCCARVLYPLDMEQSQAGRSGYGTQRRCQSCSADLAASPPEHVDLRSVDILSLLQPFLQMKKWAAIGGVFRESQEIAEHARSRVSALMETLLSSPLSGETLHSEVGGPKQ